MNEGRVALWVQVSLLPHEGAVDPSRTDGIARTYPRMSLKRNRSRSPSDASSVAASKIYRSSSIEDRASKFTAFYSPSLPLSALQQHTFFSSADHRIAAWRKPSKQRSILPGAPPIYDTGFEDDGETHAGKKIAKVMEVENVEGSLVVGRWYGGILLGPVRFKHIEDVARESIRKYKEDVTSSYADKKARPTEDPAQHRRLVGELQRRDESITVLRKLLEDKKNEDTATPSQSSPASKPIDYSTMPLSRLKQLDKARDATISWLLKQIDQFEKSQKVPAEDTHHAKTIEHPDDG